METTSDAARKRPLRRAASRPRRAVPRTRFGGGIDGNEQLTALAGVVLLVLLAVLGVTIIRIGQLLWLHLFLGVLLLGPVLLKLATTGYRVARYYLRDAIYVAKGPPMPALRAMGPLLVLTTVTVFVTGLVLLFEGPRSRATPLLIHKVSFILWLALFGAHLLAHVPKLPWSLRAVRLGADESGLEGLETGAVGRWIAIAGAIVGGLVLAVVLIPHFSLWTAPGALPHHHHH